MRSQINRGIVASHALAIAVLLPTLRTRASTSASWGAYDGNWTDPAKWVDHVVPNDFADEAFFNFAGQNGAVNVNDTIYLARLTFQFSYSFHLTIGNADFLNIVGSQNQPGYVGVLNLSTATQYITTVSGATGTEGVMYIHYDALAGTNIVYTNNGSDGQAPLLDQTGGITIIAGEPSAHVTASADHATFINNGSSANNNSGGLTFFGANSTAANATFTNNGGAGVGDAGGITKFTSNSTAGSAIFANQSATVFAALGGGQTQFYDTSNAGNGLFFNYGPSIGSVLGSLTQFHNASNAGLAFFSTSGGTTGSVNPSATEFFDTASASFATFSTTGGLASGIAGGQVNFYNTSTAANATFNTLGASTIGAYGGQVQFLDNATAGSAKFTTGGASIFSGNGARTNFFNSSSADHATFIVNGASVTSADNGAVIFYDASTADHATFTINGGGVKGAAGALLQFKGTSTAANATLTVKSAAIFKTGAGTIIFGDTSTAEDSALIAQGGTFQSIPQILFTSQSTGGESRVELLSNGTLDISSHDGPLTIGSLEGDGIVHLGSNNLTIGSNNHSTTFSGSIDESFAGSLTKIGTGTLAFTGDCSFTGPTTINSGTLGGSGTLASTIVAGSGAHTIAPSAGLSGNTATTLTVGGLTTSADTTLAFNLVTPGASSINDAISVANPDGLTLNGGTLQIAPNSTGAASLGFYSIIQYSGAIGGAGVSSLSPPAIVNNIAYIFDLTRDPGFIDLHRGFLGDANDNATVDQADFDTLAANFGQSNASWSTGDFNGDGLVNFADFALLSNNFANTLSASEAAAAGVAAGVPEPTSLFFLGAGFFGALRTRRPRTCRR